MVAWYERHAWIVFAFLAILALVFGLSGGEGPTAEDAPFGAMAADDDSDVGLELQLRGTFALGMGVFGLFVAAFAYRRFAQWSWFAMLVWPLFFLLHILAFDTWLPDGVFVALALLGLALPVRRFFPAAPATP